MHVKNTIAIYPMRQTLTKLTFTLLLLCVQVVVLFATHNRAGEITYEQIGELSIRMTITTYTKTSSVTADRDTLEVFWGDGTNQMVARTDTIFLPDDVQINKYVMDHDYPGRSTYTIYFEDPNRVANILNVNPPNSVDVPFYLSTTFTFLDPQFQGTNNSAVLLQPPLDYACVGQVFTHNPNAFDSDGDSLSYELVTPMVNPQEEVPNYFFPNEIGPGAANQVYIDPITGTFTWTTPQVQGEYNIAIRINEYRDGTLINSITRDMQILVRLCDNRPPIIQSETELCVVAGELIDLPINVDDLDSDQRVMLTATGGPFVQSSSPAILQVLPEPLPVPFTARFRWQTNCSHISPQYYQVVLRAVDNGLIDGTGLTTLQTIRIKVVGPPPENVQVESDMAALNINWALPYSCENVGNNYFQGFSVWRREGSTSFPIDTCQEGLEGRGYEKVIFNTTNNNGSRYEYLDNDVERGKTYCYRVLGEFARQSQFGFSFNKVASLASVEVCAQVSRDLPMITQVSVSDTDLSQGQMSIRWTKPFADDLDTLLHPGPYRYQLLRSEINANNYQSIFDQSIPHFTSAIDTSYLDEGLNTQEKQYQYKVEFSSNGTLYGSSAEASSIYLQTTPGDQEIKLDWSSMVPWANYQYELYRVLPNDMTELIAEIDEATYTETNLENGATYCYLVKAIGSYGLDNIEDPLFNDSQIACDSPRDNQPPCTPVLTVSNICDDNANIEDLANHLSWTSFDPSCDMLDDIEQFNIYYSTTADGELTLIDNIDSPSTDYIHMPSAGVTGCYTVTAIDSVGNESKPSNKICVDNCPLYELPNVFTPNGDNNHDLYVPRINRFVSRIELEIFNEWGNRIFQTTDPQINWDGKHSNGNDVAAGTYYYTCKVIESRVSGDIEQDRLLRGYIQVLRD